MSVNLTRKAVLRARRAVRVRRMLSVISTTESKKMKLYIVQGRKLYHQYWKDVYGSSIAEEAANFHRLLTQQCRNEGIAQVYRIVEREVS